MEKIIYMIFFFCLLLLMLGGLYLLLCICLRHQNLAGKIFIKIYNQLQLREEDKISSVEELDLNENK